MRQLSRQVPDRGRPLIWWFLGGAAVAEPSAERGAELAAAARCGSCHGSPEGASWTGGYAIETRFGTFYGPNVTFDAKTGLGAWTAADFARALREGRDPEQRPYWPAFPYPAFTRLSDADIADLWAFFITIPPVERASRPHDLHAPWGWRAALGPWRAMAFDPGTYELDPERSATWNRGAYLGIAVAHCGECHTPRGPTGGLRSRRALGGNAAPPAPAPNVTGLDWDLDAWESFLFDGVTPDGDVTGGEMRHVIRDGTRTLSVDDRRAIGEWISSLPPQGRRTDDDDDD